MPENESPTTDRLPRDKPLPRTGEVGEKKPKTERPRPHPDPTRYGDWEKNGRCIDF